MLTVHLATTGPAHSIFADHSCNQPGDPVGRGQRDVTPTDQIRGIDHDLTRRTSSKIEFDAIQDSVHRFQHSVSAPGDGESNLDDVDELQLRGEVANLPNTVIPQVEPVLRFDLSSRRSSRESAPEIRTSLIGEAILEGIKAFEDLHSGSESIRSKPVQSQLSDRCGPHRRQVPLHEPFQLGRRIPEQHRSTQ